LRSRSRNLSPSIVAVCALLALGQTGCGRPAFSAQVPANEVLADIDADSAPLILDVRTPAEYARGHVPGARNISIEDLVQRIGEIADHRDAEVVVYCERGPRALKAADLLTGAGFVSVRHLEGDMSGWREAGLPIARD
jgi:rhodanese-related sulfurtransferase